MRRCTDINIIKKITRSFWWRCLLFNWAEKSDYWAKEDNHDPRNTPGEWNNKRESIRRFYNKLFSCLEIVFILSAALIEIIAIKIPDLHPVLKGLPVLLTLLALTSDYIRTNNKKHTPRDDSGKKIDGIARYS